MAASTGLLGPPEIRLSPATTTSHRTGVPFLDLMDEEFNSPVVVEPPSPPMGLTENGAATFLSSGDPCLDFFFQVVPNTPADTVAALLCSAWESDPLTALKLICHLRAVRGTGKSDREGFYAAALWLHRHHPKTLALNVAPIADFGYMKDLPMILHRLVSGINTPKKRIPPRRLRSSKKPQRKWTRRRWRSSKPRKPQQRKGSREERLAAEMAKMKIRVEEAAVLRRGKRAEMAVRAVQRYARDPDYRFLHDRTSDFFAGLLSSDMDKLRSGGDTRSISLAAKWCPSLNSSFDRSTLLCEAVARRMFPRSSSDEYLTIEEHQYAYRVRDRLRKEVLVPLRRSLELPEVYISAGQWGSLPYNRVASVAMKNYTELFQKHDPERFGEFLSQVEQGKAKIAAGALLPHKILAPALQGKDDKVAELQWRRMVSDLSDKGKMRNCIAVCDVSGSMTGTPMDVCIALGLLISELSEEPWKGRVITFSADPQMHLIKGDSLSEKAKFVKKMDWGTNTDFQKVFDKILKVAEQGKLEAEKMVKRVFVFSDMEFDLASGCINWSYGGWRDNCSSSSSSSSTSSWETDYQAICRKFNKSGYGSAVPEIVFWNLRDSTSVPVTSEQKGVALVSGFSKNMVKPFLEGDGTIRMNPREIMETAIAGEEYKQLVVFD